MKHVCFLAVVVFLQVNLAVAQLEKGNWLLGGNLSYSSVKSSSDVSGISSTNKSTNFTLQPRIGYFPINNLAAGLGVEYGKVNSETGSNPTIETNSRIFSIAPFARYYFIRKLFIQAEYGVGSSVASISPSNTPEKKYNLSKWSAAFGYALFLNEHAAVELLLGNRSSVFNEVGGSTRNTTDELFIGLGMQVYFRA